MEVARETSSPFERMFSRGARMVAQQNLKRRPRGRVGNWLAASIFLILALPLMVFVIAAIKIESAGPIFVRRQRVAGGCQYVAVKFRTTADGRPMDLPTAVGRFLQRTSIENLPQLLNVFRGEMSCISPRPDCPFFLD
jgi:lipopolysaccharide/colanic/teichoic acid biosynthesis glycosyltransferase